MNVSELYSLTNWITKEIDSVGVVSKYQNLQSIIAIHAQPDQHKPPFESQKNDLIETLKNIPLDKLTKDQLEFLENLQIRKYIGQEGIEQVEDILYKNIIDVATSSQKLFEIINKINNGISKSNQIKSGLTDCIIEEEYELDNEILMRVSFTGNASMVNVKDFRDWGGIWYDIGRGIAIAHNSSPEDIKIVGATKGSIIIEMAVIASIAATTSKIILDALQVAEKVLDIRKKAEELRGLKLKNEQLVKDLEKEADNEKNHGIEQITESISLKLEIKKNGESDKIKALDTAVKNLVTFIEKGGVVDFVAPENNNSEDSNNVNSELRVAFQEIRKLENKIKLLENGDQKSHKL